jgi:adenylosuccinate lyase
MIKCHKHICIVEHQKRRFNSAYLTQEIRDIFTDKTFVQCLIEVEAPLARAEAKVGVIPGDADNEITKVFSNIELG